MSTAVVVDTGPLLAIVDRDDVHHQTCVDWFDRHTGTVATINHRDFRVVRPRHLGSFILVP